MEVSEGSVTLVIQIVGFLVMILGGGKYLGRNETTLSNLSKSHEDIKSTINEHIEKDDTRMEDINKKFTDIQVNMASMGRSQARTERQTRRD